MAKKQSNGKITIANIIAIVGLVLLLVFTFIGHAYMSGGELGWDILVAVAITAFAALLLWFMIKAKGAENQLDKWRKVEIAMLVCYILFAIPASLFGGIMHFFVVNDNKEQIKGYAEQDLAQIDKLFDDYNSFENTAIQKTIDGLNNAKGKAGADQEVKDIIKTTESMRSFSSERQRVLIENVISYKNRTVDPLIREIRNAVNSWSILQIPFKAKDIENLAESVGKELTECSMDENAKLPLIEYGKITSYQSKEFKINPDSLKFRKALRESSGFSVTALIVVLLIHLLILFNYIVARRTVYLHVGHGMEEDGGTLL